jgi:alkanesulfonate monooxygenase SsuD/methylene tetrahydromethanopterin reductase-like flavin-dependent oxidoreductase (luciferase family)
VARYADVWNAPGTDVEVFNRKVEILREHCRAIGRDPAEIELSIQTRVDYADLGATVATLRPLVDAGATHLTP